MDTSSDISRMQEKISQFFEVLEAYTQGNLDACQTSITKDEVNNLVYNLQLMTERLDNKQTSLAKLEKKISDLYYYAPSMFCTLDLNGNILNVNKTMVYTLQTPSKNFLELNFTDIISEDSTAIFQNGFQDFLFNVNPLRGMNLNLKGKKNQIVHVNMTWTFFSDNDRYDFKTRGIFNEKEVYGVRVVLKNLTEENKTQKQKNILFETIETMSSLPPMLGTVMDLEDMLRYMLVQLNKIIDYDLAAILLAPDEGQGVYTVASTYGMDGKGNNLIGKLFTEKEDSRIYDLITTQDIRLHDQLFFTEVFEDEIRQSGETSLIIPLVVLNETIGIMTIDKAQKQSYGKEEIALVKAFASLTCSNIQNLLLREEVQTHLLDIKKALRELESKDDILQSELDMAVFVQQGILPDEDYKWNGLRILGHYESMEKIGGDFYDIFHLPKGELAILIADVSGHGIPAALVTTMSKIAFVTSGQKFSSPKKILTEVNFEMCQHIKTDHYLSAFFLAIDKNYTITYTNAGHQKAIVYRKIPNKIEYLDTAGYFVGMLEEMGDAYEEDTTKLNYGDRIILFTDGIVETKNHAQEEFSVERLEQLILSNSHCSVNELKQVIVNEVKEFAGGESQKDDITMLIIELEENYEKVNQLLTKGLKHFHEEDHKNCLACFHEALNIDPDNVDVILYTGETYFRLRQFEESVRYFLVYIRLIKNNPHAYYHLALSHYMLNNLDQAIQANEQALEIDKKFAKSIYHLALIHKKLQKYKEAKNYFMDLLQVDPDNVKAKQELTALIKSGLC